jgi:hypothetical protein
MTPFPSHKTYAVLRVGVFSLMPSTTQLSDRIMVLKEEDSLVVQRIRAIAAPHKGVWTSYAGTDRRRVRPGTPDLIFRVA